MNDENLSESREKSKTSEQEALEWLSRACVALENAQNKAHAKGPSDRATKKAWERACAVARSAPNLPAKWAMRLHAQRDKDGHDGWGDGYCEPWRQFNLRLAFARDADDAGLLGWEAAALESDACARLIAECSWGWGLDETLAFSRFAGWRLGGQAVARGLDDEAASQALRLATLKSAFIWQPGFPWAALPQQKGDWMNAQLRKDALERWSPDSSSGCDLTEEWPLEGLESLHAETLDRQKKGRESLSAMLKAGIVDAKDFPERVEGLIESEIAASQIGAGALAMFELMPESVAAEAPWERWSLVFEQRASQSKNPEGWAAAIAFAQARCLKSVAGAAAGQLPEFAAPKSARLRL